MKDVKNKPIVILKIVVLISVFFWIVMIFTDYFRVRQDKDPRFCVVEKTIEYENGSTYICTGIGYKAVRYNRSCLTATEFGPIFIKERKC